MTTGTMRKVMTPQAKDASGNAPKLTALSFNDGENDSDGCCHQRQSAGVVELTLLI